MAKFRYLIYGVLLLLSFQASQVYAAFTCVPLKEKLRTLITEEHLAFSAIGSLSDGHVLMIFSNDEGKIKFIGVDDDGLACELLSAHDMRSPYEVSL